MCVYELLETFTFLCSFFGFTFATLLKRFYFVQNCVFTVQDVVWSRMNSNNKKISVVLFFFSFLFLKVKGYKNETKGSGGSERIKKMFNRDCQLMGLTWLLAKNKTAYIPTVSAVLRAMMYSAHPHESKCSPDQENMPLAVDSLQFESGKAPSRPSKFSVTVLPLVVLLFSCFV